MILLRLLLNFGIIIDMLSTRSNSGTIFQNL